MVITRPKNNVKSKTSVALLKSKSKLKLNVNEKRRESKKCFAHPPAVSFKITIRRETKNFSKCMQAAIFTVFNYVLKRM